MILLDVPKFPKPRAAKFPAFCYSFSTVRACESQGTGQDFDARSMNRTLIQFNSLLREITGSRKYFGCCRRSSEGLRHERLHEFAGRRLPVLGRSRYYG